MNAVAIRRRLARFWGTHGAMLGLAIDHRDSMRTALRGRGIASATPALTAEIKADVCRALAPLATTVMVDAEYGTRALEEGSVPPTCALVMPLEEQGYEATSFATTLMRDPDAAAAAARYGADGCKLLLPIRPTLSSADRQLRVAADALTLTHAQGLPLVVEPIVPRLADEPEDSYSAGYTAWVLQAARLVAGLGVDVLKLPFPARSSRAADAAAACRALHAACAGVPWVLLGGGVDTAEFEAQLGLAMAAGARGFLVGRSVWSAALLADRSARREAIERVVRPAFSRAAALATAVRV
jgi:tagatose-1,6-bisphosphate aldolase